LGELYANYKEDSDFRDFVEFNDLGLPLAYMVRERLATPSDDGSRYIMETWQLFIGGLGIEDTGFSSLNDVLGVE
jgi:hypothetical protein